MAATILDMFWRLPSSAVKYLETRDGHTVGSRRHRTRRSFHSRRRRPPPAAAARLSRPLLAGHGLGGLPGLHFRGPLALPAPPARCAPRGVI